MKQSERGNLLALDVGTVRVGVAYASAIARLPRPLQTLKNDETVWAQLEKIIREESIGKIVVGIPRNLRHADTDQTRYTEQFIRDLQARFGGDIIAQDEALTSVSAEAELKASGKPYVKADIDALAAVYILSDYLEGKH